MKIVVLDGWTLNPGDLSWDALKKLGDVTIYDRTPADKIIKRILKQREGIVYTFTDYTTIEPNIRLIEGISYNKNSGNLSIYSYFDARRTKKLYFIEE